MAPPLAKLAELLNLIENEGRWPTEMLTARAAFLAKDEGDAMEPLAYRVLLMLPATYRLWAKVRLQHLQPWMQGWVCEEMFAGVPGVGAGDASYATALLLEWCHLAGEDVTGGAADIFKCFDQIVRPI